MKKRGKVSRALRGLEDVEKNKLKRTLIVTGVVCFLIIALVIWVQLYGQNKLVKGCSYLDPITIDLLAFFAALFLFIEGFARIIEHPSASLKRQSTRIIRIAFGCAIMTLHILQFLHK